MNEEQKKALELMSIFFSGSVLETVIEAMKSDDYLPADHQVDQGETVIGELSLFERAMITARDKMIDEHNAIANRAKGMVDAASENVRKVDMDEIKKNLREVRRLSAVIQALEEFIWTNIRFRLSGQGIDGLENIGYRRGNEIVRLADAGQGDLHSFLGSMFGSMMEGGEHKCSPDCPAYEDCDLPIKQAAQG